jgi:hypothetical protein
MATDRPMQLGMVGLGRMEANLVRRLMRDGHRCVAYDRNPDVVKTLEAEGANGANSDQGVRATGIQWQATSTVHGRRAGPTSTARGLAPDHTGQTAGPNWRHHGPVHPTVPRRRR